MVFIASVNANIKWRTFIVTPFTEYIAKMGMA